MQRTNKLKGIIFICLGSALGFTAGFSQTSEVTGKILDKVNNVPLKGADVYLLHAKTGTISDENGKFALRYPSSIQNDTLVISFIGYKVFQSPVDEFLNDTTIYLQPLSISLEDSVRVSAPRIDLVKQEIPHARAEIDYRQIELQGSSEISDVFKAIPAVRIEGNDISGRQISIRGSDPGEVNVYVDGILINNLGFDNSADLSIIPTENVQKIEVLKGANLTLLGSGAFGGAVNITTRRNTQKSVFAKTKQGSFETQYYIANINFPVTNRFIVNYFGQFNGLKPGIEFFPGEARQDEKTENNQIRIRKQNHNLRFNYYTNDGEFSTRVYSYFLDYEKPFFDNNRQNYLIASKYQGSLLGIKDIDVNAHYLYSDDTIDRSQSERDQQFTDAFITQQLNLKFLKKFAYQSNDFQILAEYFHDELESSLKLNQSGISHTLYEASLYENRGSLAGVAAFSNQLTNLPFITWKTHLGLRGDFVATGDQFVSPTVGIAVEIKKSSWELRPYMNYGKNVKFQSLLDNAFLSLDDAANSRDSTLERLKPEESNAYEFGSSFLYDPNSSYYEHLEIRLAIFKNTVFNKYLRRPSDPFTVISLNGRNETLGIEGALSFNKVLRNVNFLVSFTALDISNPLFYAYKPESNYSFQFDYLTNLGFYFTATYFFEGSSVAWFPTAEDAVNIQDPEANLPSNIAIEKVNSFHDMDISIGYKFKMAGLGVNLQAAGYNIFDNSEFRDFLLKKQYFQFALSVKY